MKRIIVKCLIRWQNWLVAGGLLILFLVGFRLWPHPALSYRVGESQAIYDDQGRLLRLTLAKDESYRVWMPLKTISPQLTEGVRLYEDRWFYYHIGFNPVSLVKGAWTTYLRKERRQGGSTITMQLARMYWQIDTRTLRGKFVQILRAVQLELSYSKADILEGYLNYAPYGGNIVGVGSAALIYFNKSANDLNLPEALTLAVIPQSPSKRIVTMNDNGDYVMGETLKSARARLFNIWLNYYSKDERLRSLFELPLLMRPVKQMPFYAPHFVDQVLQEKNEALQQTNRIETTLNFKLQQILEHQIKQFVDINKSYQINNAAALLVDTRDMAVKALVGSAHFFDASIHGQVNGTHAQRSPGSTLKPLIYALALDQGILHEKSILWDIPMQFNGYAPENFDYFFLGPVTATEALIKSRNIPAVSVMAELKKPNFYQFLKQANIKNMQTEDRYGLALALGGGEVTMQELAKLYALLANKGKIHPLRFLKSDPLTEGIPLLSEAASFITLEMLRQNPRPDELQRGQPTSSPIYWKTGTSWGYRDAWTVGVFGPYVLVVWLGNFDGRGNPHFIGIEGAAPLFFSIVDHINGTHDFALIINNPPETVTQIEVCLASGDLPSQYCPRKGKTWFIPGVSPIKVDTIYRPVVMDNITNLVACPPYDSNRTHVEIYEFWPSELMKTFKQLGVTKRSPPYNPKCSNINQYGHEAPKIRSPKRLMTYTLRRNSLNHNGIALNALTDGSVQHVYWFINGAYLNEARAGETLYWKPTQAGTFTLRVVDEYGGTDDVNVKVKIIE